MLCEKCKKKEATVFYEETINEKSRSYSLCADCAKALKQSGELTMGQGLGDFFSVSPFGTLADGLFGGFFGLPETPRTSKKHCPLCGASFEDFRRSGQAGCPSCYETFSVELKSTLHSIHGNAAHVGRAPAKCKKQTVEKSRLEELRDELARAIAEENFENAAKLRDEIRELQNQG